MSTTQDVAAAAAGLDDDRLRILAATALLLAASDPGSPVPQHIEADPVFPLLTGCLALSHADKVRLNDLLGRLIEQPSP